MKVLLLSDSEIQSLLAVNEVVEAVEDAFKEKASGKVQMPAKSYLYLRKYNGDLRTMPSYIETTDACGVKIVNVHPDNRRYGLPTIAATILLVDPKTGLPTSILSGTWITAMRTGAAGAVATKYLARKDSTVLGIVGAGVQADAQLKAISSVLALKQVNVWDIKPEFAERFVSGHRGECEFDLMASRTVEECIEEADVICTVTPARSPVIKDEWVKEGQHINAIGADAPGKQELDPRILRRSRVIVDDREQAIHSGEINVPIQQGILKHEGIYGELGEIVAGLKEGRMSSSDITVFDSTGLSIQDVAAATIAYRKAKDKSIGMFMSF